MFFKVVMHKILMKPFSNGREGAPALRSAPVDNYE
jgi:hypothetical protein